MLERGSQEIVRAAKVKGEMINAGLIVTIIPMLR